jgi:hypothetical protein
MLPWITCITLFLFQFEIQILIHSWVKLSCYKVLIWAQHPWCCGKGLSAPGSLRRGHHHHLQLDIGCHHLQPTIQARVAILLPHLPARDTGHRRCGTSSWRVSPAMGNASVDDTDIAAATTFFFTADCKSFVHTFNCSIRNTSKCRTSCLLVHLYLQVSFFVDRAWLRWRGSKHWRIRRGRGRWHRQRCGAVIEFYVMYLCHKTTTMYCCVKTIWIVIDLCLVVWILYALLYNFLLYGMLYRLPREAAKTCLYIFLD